MRAARAAPPYELEGSMPPLLRKLLKKSVLLVGKIAQNQVFDPPLSKPWRRPLRAVFYEVHSVLNGFGFSCWHLLPITLKVNRLNAVYYGLTFEPLSHNALAYGVSRQYPHHVRHKVHGHDKRATVLKFIASAGVNFLEVRSAYKMDRREFSP